MGEYADAIIEGSVCQYCGVAMSGQATGHPRSCGGCHHERGGNHRRKNQRKRRRRQANRVDRHHSAIEAAESVEQWCFDQNLRMSVHNGGHHWIVLGARLRVEWWPSSGKLVTGTSPNRFKHMQQARDVEQFRIAVTREIEKRGQSGSRD